MELCGYGCGREAKFPPRKGQRKWCCSEYFAQCPNKKTTGIPSWNKGLTKKTSESVKKYSESRRGCSSWNKGLTKESNNKIKEIADKISIGYGYGPGYLSGKSKSSISINKKATLNNYSPSMLKKRGKNIRKVKIGMTYNKIDNLYRNHPFFCKIEKPRENKNKDIEVKCKTCKNWFVPTSDQITTRWSSLEKEEGNDGNFFYCSEKCKQECPLYNLRPEHFLNNTQTNQQHTSEEYNTWRQEVLKRAEYKCEYCGEPAEHCHHSRPQKLEPFFSLDPDYGIACCSKCHYEKGHKDECSTGQLSTKVCG